MLIGMGGPGGAAPSVLHTVGVMLTDCSAGIEQSEAQGGRGCGLLGSVELWVGVPPGGRGGLRKATPSSSLLPPPRKALLRAWAAGTEGSVAISFPKFWPGGCSGL